MKTNLPVAQGMYDPAQEHEACGIGMIANIDGTKSHNIVQNAINILCNLEHRGGQSADTSTGDGAGILTQIPHHFFKNNVRKKTLSFHVKVNTESGWYFYPRIMRSA